MKIGYAILEGTKEKTSILQNQLMKLCNVWNIGIPSNQDNEETVSVELSNLPYQEFHVYDDEIEGNVSFAEENIANLTSEENKNYLLMVNSDDEILNDVLMNIRPFTRIKFYNDNDVEIGGIVLENGEFNDLIKKSGLLSLFSFVDYEKEL